MRIFQVIENYANLSLRENRTWLRNLHEPLIEMGHEVTLVTADEGRLAMQTRDSALRSAFSEKLLNQFRAGMKNGPYDFAFFYLMDGMCEPGVLEEIRKTGTPTANFSCNNVHQFYLVEPIIDCFDFNLYSEKAAGEKFSGRRSKAIWWPMASNPRYFHPVKTKFRHDVSFVGACYAGRLEEAHQLLLHGLPLKVFGPGWIPGEPAPVPPPHRSSLLGDLTRVIKRRLRPPVEGSRPSLQENARRKMQEASMALSRYSLELFPGAYNKPLADSKMIEMYSASRINLGFLEVFDGHDPVRRRLWHMHLRDFEVPLCGGLYCTDYSDEMAEMFEPDKEVITCRGLQERIEKLRYYLGHPGQAKAIRQAGYRRALRDHTYQKRFRNLFRKIGLRG